MKSLPSIADQVLDLGEKGCGQLVMELMLAMSDLFPGQTLLVTAYDPAAAGDIAAWCRMTGNTLLQTLSDVDSSGHQFLLQKGSNPHAQ
jgi:TusA-related sulfurtransferase